MEISTLIGLVLGIGGILLGNAVEGGHVANLWQTGAALIVFGGTFGAVMVGNSMSDIRTGLKLLPWGFTMHDSEVLKRTSNEISQLARLARKESILAIEQQLNRMTNPYLKNVFRFVIDGVDPQTLRQVFEPEIHEEEKRLNAGAKIFIDAGGYAPTIGIIGAVLGLIHVMANLTDTGELGRGIATAFVATIYGIASANIVFIPLGNKIRRRIQHHLLERRLVLEGGVAVLSGMNPYVVEEKMQAFLKTTVDLKTGTKGANV